MLKKFARAALFSFFAVSASAGVWDTSTPAGNAPISQGDDRIREMKTALQEALQWSGVFPGTNPLTAPMFQWTLGNGLLSARPTASLQNGQLYYSTNTYRLDRYDSATSSWITVAVGSSSLHTVDVSSGSIGASSATISSQMISNGNITTTGDDVDISSHVTITGNLTVTGSITNSGISVVSAHKLTGSQTIGAVPSNITFSTERIDQLSEFNGSTFTAANTGIYSIQCNAEFLPGGVDTGLELNLVKNGGTLSTSNLETIEVKSAVVSVQTIESLTAGDVITCQGTRIGVSDVTLTGDANAGTSLLIHAIH